MLLYAPVVAYAPFVFVFLFGDLGWGLWLWLWLWAWKIDHAQMVACGFLSLRIKH
jgi:hypothetical protein